MAKKSKKEAKKSTKKESKKEKAPKKNVNFPFTFLVTGNKSKETLVGGIFAKNANEAMAMIAGSLPKVKEDTIETKKLKGTPVKETTCVAKLQPSDKKSMNITIDVLPAAPVTGSLVKVGDEGKSWIGFAASQSESVDFAPHVRAKTAKGALKVLCKTMKLKGGEKAKIKEVKHGKITVFQQTLPGKQWKGTKGDIVASVQPLTFLNKEDAPKGLNFDTWVMKSAKKSKKAKKEKAEKTSKKSSKKEAKTSKKESKKYVKGSGKAKKSSKKSK